ncbi:MAG: hypothetical protein PHR30_12385 [Gallionellaceae bacterium]|nr:hypothetical protein [Gallionellaceae bacterium]
MSESSNIAIGAKVMVKRKQDRLGGPQYPGRIGIVVRENIFGRESGWYWYVQLEATRRAKRRIALFCAKELELAQEGTS